MGIGSGLNFSTTPAMGLSQPIPNVCGAFGVEPPGKSWLELINSSLGLVDGHNHAPGFGVQVPSAGLNINADVPWNANNLTGLRSARFSAIALGSIGASDIGCLVVSGADLYYVDTSGTQVRLTSGGGVAGTPGAIGGLVSPAAVTYTTISKLFTFTSSSGFAANLSGGPLSIGDATVSGGKAATLSVPASLAANYAVKLWSGLPAAQKIVTLDAAGQLAATYDVDGTTLQVSGSTLGVKPGGIGATQIAGGSIGSTQIASLGVQTGNIAANAVTPAKMGSIYALLIRGSDGATLASKGDTTGVSTSRTGTGSFRITDARVTTSTIAVGSLDNAAGSVDMSAIAGSLGVLTLNTAGSIADATFHITVWV